MLKSFLFQVYLNGWRYCTMNHVIPVTNLAAVSIEGDVVINSLGFVPVSRIYK